MTRWQCEVARSHRVVTGALDVQRTAEAECEQYRAAATQFEADLRRMQSSYQTMVNELTNHICGLTEKLATKDASFLLPQADYREFAMRGLAAQQAHTASS